jgi:1-acyl-sn-glycerol-3-phosphate acyltransferase
MLLEKNLEYSDPRDRKTYYLENTTTRQVLTATTRAVFALMADLQVSGAENLPQTGPVVLASNHLTNFDVFPMQYVLPRLIFFMGKAELFNNPVLDPLLRRLGGFPVNRGVRDDWALQQAALILEKGLVLGIFPEGKRSKGRGLGPAKTGAARLAMEARCPVVPMGVEGTELIAKRFPRRSKVKIRVGPPLFPEPNENFQAFTTRIMYSVAELLPPDLRGVYASPGAAQTDRI